MSKIAALYVSIGAKTSNFEKGMSDVQKSMQATGKKLTAIGKNLSLKVTAPLALMAGVSVKAFASFDKAMTESMAIMGNLSDKTKKDMADLAKTISTKTTFAAKELAEAYFFLASAGMDAEQSMGALNAVAQFGQAGAFDLATATDLLTDAQTALGLSSKNATKNQKNLVKVSDVLVKANTLANASVQQFAEALTNKASAALVNVNKGLEEGVAVLAAFADKGVKGQIAGQQLGMMLNALDMAARNNKAAWDKFNISLFDSKGEMRSIGDIIGSLEKLLGKMTTEQRAATLAMLGFNVRTKASILTLMGSSEKIKQWTKDLKEAGGTTQIVADKQMKAFSNQMKVMKNNVTLLAMAFGETLAPAVGGLAKALGGAAKGLSGLPGGIRILITVLLGLAAAIGPVLWGFGALIKQMPTLKLGFKSLTKIIPVLKVALRSLLGPIGLIATAAGVAYVGIKKLIDAKNDMVDADFRAAEAEKKLGDKLREITDAAGLTRREMIALTRKYEGNTTALVMAIKHGKENKELQEALAKVGAKHKEVIDKQKEVTEKASVATSDFSKKLDELKGKIEPVSEALDESATAMGAFAVEIPKAIPGLKELTGEGKKMGDVVGGAFGKIIDGGKELSSGLPKLKTDFSGFTKHAEEASEKLRKKATQVAGEIGKAFATMVNQLGPLLQILADEVGGSFGSLISSVGLAIGQIKESTEKSLKGIAEAIGPQLAGKIGGAIGQMISGAKKSFASLGAALGGTIGSIFGPVGGAIGSALGGLFGGLFKKVDKAAQAAEAAVKHLNAQIKEATSVMSKYGEISESTAKKMAEARKTMAGWKTETIYFADVIRDVGVNQENVNALWEKTRSILDQMGQGLITTAEGTKVLDEAFQLLVDGAKKLGQEGSAAMIEFIKATREMGVEIKSVTEYVQGQLSKIPAALSAMIANLRDLQIIPDDVVTRLEANAQRIDNILAQQAENATKARKKFLEAMYAGAEKGGGEPGGPSAVIALLDFGPILEQFEQWMEKNKKGWGDIGEWIDKYGKKLRLTEEQIAGLTSLAGKWGDQQDSLNTRLETQIEAIKKRLGEDLTGAFEKWMKKNDKGWGDIIEWANKYNVNINKIIPGITKKLDNMSTIALASFNSMIDSGMSYTEALKKMQEPLIALRDKYAALGIKGNAAIEELFKIIGVREEHKKLFSAIEGNIEILKALGNTGYLTQESMKALTDDARKYYRQLQKAGMTSDEALRTMAPNLQAIYDYAQKYGIELDKNTLKLIKQAKEQGLIHERELSANETMLAGFGHLIKALGGDVPAAMQKAMKALEKFTKKTEEGKTGLREFGGEGKRTFDGMTAGFNGAIGQANALNTTISNINPQIDIGFNIAPLPSISIPDISVGVNLRNPKKLNLGLPSFQNEGYIPRKTLAMVHGGEVVADVQKLQRGMSKFSGMFEGGGQASGGQPANFNFYINALDGADVEKVVTGKIMPVLKRAYRDNLGGNTQDLSMQMKKYNQ